jgi:hypothetical protein
MMVSWSSKNPREGALGAGCPAAEHSCTSLLSADYGFEYSDDEPEEEDVDVENQYYNAKGAFSVLLGLPLPCSSAKASKRPIPCSCLLLVCRLA